MDLKNSSQSAFPRRPILHALLILTAVFILFFKLGERGFENKDTARYVEIVWEMQRSSDYVVPRFNTVIFTEKPILLIWLIALFSGLSGAITPLTARLPTALSALGCVLLTLSLGKRLFGQRGGLLAGFILCSNFAFAWEARASRTDMLLTFFVTLTLYLLYLGFTGGARKGRYFIAAYFAAGLAALTKGPIGIGFPAIVFFCYLASRRRLNFLRKMHLAWGILIVIAIQAAWYAPFLVRIGAEGRSYFYEMYIYKENLLRFTTGFDHYEPFWFYIPDLLPHFLPWSPFLILYPLALLIKNYAAGERDCRFPIVWFLSIFVFLTISSGKDSRYALPLYPAAALLVADFWDRMMNKWERYKTTLVVSFALIVIAFTSGWIVYNARLSARDFKRARQENLAGELAHVVGTHQLATYGPTDDRFGRRMALGFFLGRPVIFIDRKSELLDYLRSEERVFCLMQTAVYERLRKRFRNAGPSVASYRYDKKDLVLISNK